MLLASCGGPYGWSTRGRPRRGGARRGRELGRGRTEAAVDDAHHAARLGHADLGLVGVAARGRRRRLGVVAPAQVLVGLVTAGGAELGARGVEERGVGDLLAAALAQELRLEPVEGVDVGARERRGARAVLRVPQVDAGQVDVDVAQQLASRGALRLDRLGLQRGRLVEDLLGRLVGVEPQHELDGRHAGHVDERGDGVGARLVEQQVAVLRGDVAGGEGHARVRVAVDVRHAVGVALDARAHRADAGRGARDGVVGDERRVVLVDQRGRLVEAGAVGARDELRVGHVAEERGEAVVHLRLRLGREHPGKPGPGHAGLTLAVGDDVQGGGRRGGRRENAEHDHGEREHASQDVSSSGHAGRRRPTMARHATTARLRRHRVKPSVRSVTSRRCEEGRASGVVLARHATTPPSHPRGARRDGRADTGGSPGRRRQADGRGRRPGRHHGRGQRLPRRHRRRQQRRRPGRGLGRREINWDGVPDSNADPESVPGRHLPRPRDPVRHAGHRLQGVGQHAATRPRRRCASATPSSRSSRRRGSSRRPARTSTTATSSRPAPRRRPRPTRFGVVFTDVDVAGSAEDRVLRPRPAPLLDTVVVPASPQRRPVLRRRVVRRRRAHRARARDERRRRRR